MNILNKKIGIETSLAQKSAS